VAPSSAITPTVKAPYAQRARETFFSRIDEFSFQICLAYLLV
jgi:hypothetical protein